VVTPFSSVGPVIAGKYEENKNSAEFITDITMQTAQYIPVKQAVIIAVVMVKVDGVKFSSKSQCQDRGITDWFVGV
jgi:hypothetical protein